MNQKFLCCKCKVNLALWLYMPSDREDTKIEDNFFCDECVLRGCSCNDIQVNYYEFEDDLEELNHQANYIRNLINQDQYIMLNYGKVEHYKGEELEIQKDMNIIRNVVNNVTNEQLRHFSFKPLDGKGREYPCCEYHYDVQGFLIKDFINEKE